MVRWTRKRTMWVEMVGKAEPQVTCVGEESLQLAEKL
jgi:hypothetical protein